MIFDHIQIKVSDIDASRRFYDAIMNVLGHKVVFEYESDVIGYGSNPHDMFEICRASESAPLSKAVHVAFVAQSEEMVKEFYKIALNNGGKCHGKPGLRDYEEGYFAAFVLDPDGHNIEAVYSTAKS